MQHHRGSLSTVFLMWIRNRNKPNIWEQEVTPASKWNSRTERDCLKKKSQSIFYNIKNDKSNQVISTSGLLDYNDRSCSSSIQRRIILSKEKYQSPSLVIFAEGKIFFKAAGTFPENDGSTGTKWGIHLISYIIRLRRSMRYKFHLFK